MGIPCDPTKKLLTHEIPNSTFSYERGLLCITIIFTMVDDGGGCFYGCLPDGKQRLPFFSRWFFRRSCSVGWYGFLYRCAYTFYSHRKNKSTIACQCICSCTDCWWVSWWVCILNGIDDALKISSIKIKCALTR
jgi:hypothetical protein